VKKISRKEDVRTGISVAGGIKNYLDHRKFRRRIDDLEYKTHEISQKISFSRIPYANLSSKLSRFYKQFIELYNYTKVNIKKLFYLLNVHNKEIKELKSKVRYLEEKIRKLEKKDENVGK